MKYHQQGLHAKIDPVPINDDSSEFEYIKRKFSFFRKKFMPEKNNSETKEDTPAETDEGSAPEDKPAETDEGSAPEDKPAETDEGSATEDKPAEADVSAEAEDEPPEDSTIDQ